MSNDISLPNRVLSMIQTSEAFQYVDTNAYVLVYSRFLLSKARLLIHHPVTHVDTTQASSSLRRILSLQTKQNSKQNTIQGGNRGVCGVG